MLQLFIYSVYRNVHINQLAIYNINIITIKFSITFSVFDFKVHNKTRLIY